MLILCPADRTVELAQIDEAIDSRPLSIGEVELLRQSITKRRGIEAPFDDPGEAVGVRQA